MHTRKPPHLRPGDTIGIVAPSSAPADAARLEAGLARLRASGFSIVCHRSSWESNGYLAGTDEVRLSELNEYLVRTDIHALLCVRGGFGALRILPGLDYASARRHPKLLIGYSDITALQLALYERAGWTSLAGPMAAVDWPEIDSATEALFHDLARGGTPDPLFGPSGESLQPVRPGTAEGTLLGGNLTLITHLIGTPYLPSLDGALLFLEEVGEAPYRIDGMLAHLRLSGILSRLGGVILGGFTEAEPLPGKPSLSLDAVFDHYFGSAPYPVARGLMHGHFPVKNTMPIGVRARLAVSESTAALSILEPVTA